MNASGRIDASQNPGATGPGDLGEVAGALHEALMSEPSEGTGFQPVR